MNPYDFNVLMAVADDIWPWCLTGLVAGNLILTLTCYVPPPESRLFRLRLTLLILLVGLRRQLNNSGHLKYFHALDHGED